MTSIVHPFSALEPILVTWLKANTPSQIHVATELPHDFQLPGGPTAMLPCHIIDRISGANYDSAPILDRPIIDVDTYARTRGEAQTYAEEVRFALQHRLAGQVVAGNVFTRCRVILAPRSLPHANPAVRRYSANYELFLHPQP